MQWKRAHLLWASLVMQCLLVGIWEFSYSNTFATYVYQFIVGFKIAQVRTIWYRTARKSSAWKKNGGYQEGEWRGSFPVSRDRTRHP